MPNIKNCGQVACSNPLTILEAPPRQNPKCSDINTSTVYYARRTLSGPMCFDCTMKFNSHSSYLDKVDPKSV